MQGAIYKYRINIQVVFNNVIMVLQFVGYPYRLNKAKTTF
jgi:hypothetical protein